MGEQQRGTCASTGNYWDSGPRREVARLVPAGARSLLDVGCSHGGFAAGLAAERPGLGTWGIDPDPTVAGDAAGALTHFVPGWFPDDLPEGRRWDCISFIDSLEHFPDPWATLRHAVDRLEPGGSIVAAIPNLRHYTVLLPLVVQGRFRYAERGVLDRTHLRFFTRSSIIELFDEVGCPVEEMARGMGEPTWPRRVAAAGGPLTRDLRTLHHCLRARPADR
jgi:2-polyprenyl-3-methyl-5-hydroxy-6-metoxy-1,4-benzoquinol methylase